MNIALLLSRLFSSRATWHQPHARRHALQPIRVAIHTDYYHRVLAKHKVLRDDRAAVRVGYGQQLIGYDNSIAALPCLRLYVDSRNDVSDELLRVNCAGQNDQPDDCE